MSKKIFIEMPDKSVWAVEPSLVAEDRANYYAQLEGFERDSEQWKAERQFALESKYELIDWCHGNMDWKDLQAKMVRPPTEADYETWFACSDPIVEVGEEEELNDSFLDD